MFVNWLRENQLSAGFLTIIRLYLGYSWIRAGYHKVTDGFDASGYLQGAIAKASGENPTVQGWWASFLEGFALPNAGLFSFLVAWGELLVGLGLILGCLTTAAAFFGIIMNFAFMFSGTISTNPQMILLTIFILIAGYNAGKIGIDRYIIPIIRNQMKGKSTRSEIASS
ncbi:DoxX family membrane protein [Bacillus sp. DTU_2020_1000418_1_SI_GHA_SEK_038]|uniref:DoxX family membrane protein n=1 Tax=Bacillus sp. DTU_2020_1000418_1_SI_GHA_SEK_038 TaxID=3077585 RepID=UPI0028ECB711|nr:DoxX family membrane protein [Bacillus sp. DTU_2020_1000418_1_SI_GHA_SEK_038]WNS73832.1 DoxX family membrane protein [Bacillus sp. DTU_2020_1000418_1_SI_GHA_SEK_038]